MSAARGPTRAAPGAESFEKNIGMPRAVEQKRGCRFLPAPDEAQSGSSRLATGKRETWQRPQRKWMPGIFLCRLNRAFGFLSPEEGQNEQMAGPLLADLFTWTEKLRLGRLAHIRVSGSDRRVMTNVPHAK